MANRYYSGPASDHFDGKRFFHPGLPASDKSLLNVLRWRLLGRRARWPENVPAIAGIRPLARVEGLQITAIGHSSLLIQVAECNILLDPVWAERASPFSHFGPRRRNPPAIAFADLPPVDAVLLTHNHYDHMDLSAVKRLWEIYQPHILTPLGNDRVIQRSAPQVRVQTGDWWDRFFLPCGIVVTVVPSYHWSSRSLADRRMALWGGFYLETPQGSMYCAGDTAYRDGRIFQEIGARLGAPDLAILPIGAYAPRWFMKVQHADPEEAVRIAEDCRAKQVLGIHWGTFPLTDEPLREPEERFYTSAQSSSLSADQFAALHSGSIWTLSSA